MKVDELFSEDIYVIVDKDLNRFKEKAGPGTLNIFYTLDGLKRLFRHKGFKKSPNWQIVRISVSRKETISIGKFLDRNK